MENNHKPRRFKYPQDSVFLTLGLLAPLGLYAGLSWQIPWLSFAAAGLVAAIMLGVLIKP